MSSHTELSQLFIEILIHIAFFGRLLYVLLFIMFSTSAFYDPARRALTPSLVPKNMLHLATTLDAFAWSFTAAIGASLGGLAASKIGPYACFVLDSVTYLLATLCAHRLKVILRSITVQSYHINFHVVQIVVSPSIKKLLNVDTIAQDQ